jgi:nicotinamide phosphoribosyltransferase
VAAYAARVASLLGPNDDDYARIRELHRLGYLPLEFRALPEGTTVPMRIPMLTVENTHPDFFWLTNYIESVMSSALWHPITSATQAWHLRQLLDSWAMRTVGTTDAVGWQGHDFSLRGLEGIAAAGASGAGHLLSFRGTDSLPSLDFVDVHYASELGSLDNGLLGGSVPATEHSVMSAGGEVDERQTYQRLLKLYPTGIVSVVSDTWDLWRTVTQILPSLRDEIMGRDGKLVVRPDSGDPVDIICGNPVAPEGSPAHQGVARLLAEEFGTTINAQGYLELDPHIGMVYGDSITYERAAAMCERLAAAGFASTNIVLGVGSFVYQYVTRDSLGMAMKATWARVEGVGRDLFKDPVTDDGIKRSARGRLAVRRDAEGELALLEQATPEQEAASLLTPVWRDGRFLRTQSFADIRATLHPGRA